MGLARRKVSGRIIGGSRMIVDGQPIYSVTNHKPDIKKTRKPEDIVEGSEIPTQTTTTTQNN